MTQFNHPYRHLVQITLEAVAPLRIGSGEKGIKTDALVIRDVNGLPFIPGTTLAGLIGHALPAEGKKLMGDQTEGSRLILTEAKLLDRNGNAIDGLIDTSDPEDKRFLELFERLPIRQHVRINHRGTAEKAGKFDEEVVLKGSRFCFEMELMASQDATDDIETLLGILQSPAFRIGSGSRSGFGEIKVAQCFHKRLCLNEKSDLDLYLSKSSKIGETWEGWEKYPLNGQASDNRWIAYRLSLKPEDFILFGSGFGDPEGADMTYVREAYIDWSSGKGTLSDQCILIPAASVKGALSHRTAFHYNRLSGAFLKEDGSLENGKDRKEVVGKNNPAVQSIFGSEGDKVSGRVEKKSRGRLLISDVLFAAGAGSGPKILNHVSIDRFTGGAIDGALFQEQTFYAKGETFYINFLVADDAFPVGDENIRKALEAALEDVATGMLPLGGGVNRGNGVFIGTVETFNKEKKQWERLA